MNMTFLNIMLCCCFSSEAVAENNPTENQIDAEIQATWRHAPAWKLTEGKCYKSLQIAKIDLHYQLQLLASEYQKQSPGGILRNKCF